MKKGFVIWPCLLDWNSFPAAPSQGEREEREKREGERVESGYCLAARKIAMTTYQAHERARAGAQRAGAGGLAGEGGPS